MELKQLAQKLKEELEGNTSFTYDTIDQCNNPIILCRNLLTDFKKEVVKNGFKAKSIEIEFFKDIKQVPLSNLIYFLELKSIEIHFPKGNEETQKIYIQKRLKKLNKFYFCNLDFVQYIEQQKTYLDDRYFTRKYFNDFNVTDSKYYFRDPEFSSSHDLLLGKLHANKRIIEYLENRLKGVGKSNESINGKLCNKLNWTGSKTDMTELGYALKFQGAVNYGNVNINDIIRVLEKSFNFNSGDPYKNLSEMRIRKKSRTKFLDELSIGLLSKMNESYK